MDTNYAQTHRLGLPAASHCSTAPPAMAARRCRLKALVTEIVAIVAQLDFCHGLVGTKCIGEGLQSWHEALAKWTADLLAFHCCCVMHGQLAIPHVKHKHAQRTCQDGRHVPNMTPGRSSCHHPAILHV